MYGTIKWKALRRFAEHIGILIHWRENAKEFIVL